MKTNFSGRSTLEMMGVLAIIGVLTIGGLQGYQLAMTKLKAIKTMNQLAEVSTNIRTLYMQQDSYIGLDNNSAVQMSALPLDMGTDGILYSPFRGKVTIGTGKLLQDDPENTHHAFYLIYDTMNKQLCMHLASADWSGKGVNLVALGVFGSNIERSQIEELAQNSYLNYEGYDGEYGIATLEGSVLSVPIPLVKAGKLCDCDKQHLSCTMFWKYR